MKLAITTLLLLSVGVDARLRALHPVNGTGVSSILQPVAEVLSQSNTTLVKFLGNVAEQVQSIQGTVEQNLEDILRNNNGNLVFHTHGHIHDDENATDASHYTDETHEGDHDRFSTVVADSVTEDQVVEATGTFLKKCGF